MSLTWQSKQDFDEATLDVEHSNLIGYYPFNDQPGSSVARDVSQNNNNGAIQNGPVLNQRGVNGTSSFSFDGTDDRVELPTGIVSSGSDLTVATWYKTPSIGNSETLCTLRADVGFILGISEEDDDTDLEVWFGGSWYQFTTSAPTGEWTHVAVTYDDSTGNIELYLNGNSVNSASDTLDSDSKSENNIGSRQSTSSSFFGGRIDSFFISQSVLSSSQIQGLYEGKQDDGFVHEDFGDRRDNQIRLGYPTYDRGTNTDLKAYWPLDEEGGQTAYDYSRNNNDGTQSYGVTFGSAGVFGGTSAGFDGADDHIDVSSFDLDVGNGGATGFTAMAWVNSDISASNLSQSRTIMRWEVDGSNNWDFGAGPDRWEFEWSNTTIVPTASFSANEWHHVAFTVDTSGNLTAYVDGSQVDSASVGSASGTTTLTIGNRPGNGTFWDGRIDEARVYKRTLTSTEISNIYLSDGNNRTITLPWKTDSANQDVSNLQLQNLNYKTNDGQITAYVESDTSGDNTVDETSDPISLGASGTFSGGDGTSSNPYKIETLDQLDAIRNDLGAYYELIDDIDASATRDAGNKFTAIGSSGSPFLGQLDGQNHTIKDIDIDGTTTDIGIFQYIGSGGVVKNLKVNSPNVVRSGSTGEGVHAGTIAGQSSSGEIRGCVVTIENSDYIEGRETTGGIVGQSVNGSPMPLVKNCEVIVNSTDGVRHGLASTTVGGIVGINEGEVFECVARGTGTLTSEEEAGGVVGENSGYGNDGGYIEHCVGRLEIAAPNASDAGGLTGQDLSPDGPTINGYTAAVVDSGATNAGAILGNHDSSTQFDNTYWDTEATNLTTAIGTATDSNYDVTGETTANMKSFSTFDSIWNISQDIDRSFVWHISPDFNDGYPYIQDLIHRYPVGRQTEFDISGLSTDNDKFRLRLECSTDNPHYSPVIHSAELGQAINNSVILTWDNEDWDSAQSDTRTIHDTVGDRDGHVQLGYPASDSGLVAYYSMDDSGYEIVNDQSGNGQDGEIIGAQSENVGVLGNTSFGFDGADDYILPPTPMSNLGQPATAFSLFSWINTNSPSTQQRIVGIDSSNGLFRTVINSDGTFDGALWDGNNTVSINTTSSVTSNTWHLCVFTWDGSTARLYFDGTEENNVSFTSSLGTRSKTNHIGYNVPSSNTPFDGEIDEVRIYNRALSSSEVQDFYDTASSGTHTTSRKTV